MEEKEEATENTLTPKQEKFINAYIETSNVTEASKKAKISRNTAYTYLKDDNVKAIILQRKSELLQSTNLYLQNNIYTCSEELMKIIKADDTPASVKIQAINSVFNNCKNLTEITDIETRLAEIEAQLNQEKADII